MREFLDPEAATGTSSAATEKATGKPWAEWMALLDAAGALEMSHKEIVAYLTRHTGVSAWWQQQLTVGYEKSRGLRQQHEMRDGFQISRSKTIAAPIEAVYDAWTGEAARARWLPDAAFAVRSATPPRTLRLTWSDGTMVEVRLADKGGRTTVTVQQNKLPDAEAAEGMKTYWAEALGRLGTFLGPSSEAH